ncbi:MAG: hypothetical protein QOI11_3448 [Candidatus Eremiobacteraeota bacterium]|jgi:hypothetical protein|nr:hypothetical protein [Candidatus Eremiobacteraeota bacterium]
MPEFRFEDLDLREEPPREKAEGELDGATNQTETCTATQRCTRICCI